MKEEEEESARLASHSLLKLESLSNDSPEDVLKEYTTDSQVIVSNPRQEVPRPFCSALQPSSDSEDSEEKRRGAYFLHPEPGNLASSNSPPSAQVGRSRSRKLQPLEFPSIRDPKRTVLCHASDGCLSKRVLTKEGMYYLQMENKGTGGVMSARSFVTYQFRPLSWEPGGEQIKELICDDSTQAGSEKLYTDQLSCDGPVFERHFSQGGSESDSGGCDQSQRLRNLPIGPCHTELIGDEEEAGRFEYPGQVDFRAEDAGRNAAGDASRRSTLSGIPRLSSGVACYKDTPISVRFMAGTFSCARGSSKIYYFYTGEAFQRLFVDLSFSWGKATRVKLTLGYGGKFEPIKPTLNLPLPSYPYRPARDRFRILSLDGGGVLGGSILVILENIEKELRRTARRPDATLYDHFDMIVGTSTGGMIAAALLKGFSVRDLRERWKHWAQTIFGGSRTALSALLFNEGYDVEPTKQLLQSVLGHEPMSCHRRPNGGHVPLVCITSTDVSHKPYQLYLHRNYDTTENPLQAHDRSDEGMKYPGRVPIEGSMLPLWLVSWIAGSAPTYIKGPTSAELSKMGMPVRSGRSVHLVDGAFLANNPAIVALQEGARYKGVTLSEFIRNHLECLVSVGTGVVHKRKTETGKGGNLSSLQILLNAPHLLLEASSVHIKLIHDLLVDKGEEIYFRFNTPGLGDSAIDDTQEEQMQFVTDATQQYMEEEKYYDTRRLVRALLSADD
eukprot:GHVH01006102.1.p1 GENE.GHVH01006102.1~~GHVH01006102.1.p1  ORF type:complete len:728 (-),score=71.88 GHVH01006102.1:81-2264(-)